ncbi:lanthionine synthetase C family protein [Frankia sp. AgB1.9]|uniref:lanthionine synthetase C family protein n=1 Tax=unclassified Frankia TaxID=2632575 RepID=UPI001931E1E9|nr:MULTISPECIES: lanthionine synthetase C family protein [unclassified Frankia]MBL7493721.1 lanthionine synthetase C family protein [Frankia sp. AgW1.1]MBL7552795.1 lanthionine synthetase C family protein [Frankia sp. AgB1.9]MBL7625399.1 lanthionine synthetase C family protein [Frankia sp. AgB1.8]
MTTPAIPAALALADELATRLADPHVVWPGRPPAETRCWPQSLAGGAVGIALLHLERARSGLGSWKTAHRWLSEAASGEVTGAPNASLFFGAPALAFVLNIAAEHPEQGRFHRALAALDRATIAVTRTRLTRAQARIDHGDHAEMREFDLIRGLTGLTAYHLSAHPDHVITRDCLAYLVRLTEPLPRTDSALPPWWTPVAPNGEPDSRYPRGHGNFGVSHGIGAVLAVLSLALLAGMGGPPDLARAIDRLAAWTDLWRQHDSDAPWWPGLVTPEQIGQGRVHSDLRPVASWCYGVAGTARAQQLAGLALRDLERRQAAEAAMLAVLRSPAQLGRLSSTGLCHGTAGLLHCAWRMAADATTPEIGAELPQLATHLATQLTNGPAAPNPDLLDGITGAALALHTLGTGRAPAPFWDSFLTLA